MYILLFLLLSWLYSPRWALVSFSVSYHVYIKLCHSVILLFFDRVAALLSYSLHFKPNIYRIYIQLLLVGRRDSLGSSKSQIFFILFYFVFFFIGSTVLGGLWFPSQVLTMYIYFLCFSISVYFILLFFDQVAAY